MPFTTNIVCDIYVSHFTGVGNSIAELLENSIVVETISNRDNEERPHRVIFHPLPLLGALFCKTHRLNIIVHSYVYTLPFTVGTSF